MSHFTTLKTTIRDLESLLKALADMGLEQVEVYETAKPLYGYEGDRRAENAEIIIRRQHIGRLSNDIGFQQQPDGTFLAIISDYDRVRYSQAWVGQLTQRYAYHALMANAPKEGFTVEQEHVLDDGTLRIVVGRWV